jgi:hypothetical protein
VALVITLVMLSVVTLMAITFLAVSRRQRAAVSLGDDQAVCRHMGEAALARAETEIMARVLGTGSLLGHDLMASTNFINPRGFDQALNLNTPNLTNVNYDYVVGGVPVTLLNDRLRNIANLQLDPRPPVYVPVPGTTNLDFRFYLDLNRNGRFETNGLQPILGRNGLPLQLPLQMQSGDPEWLGVLANPNAPHSATNRFLGRYAYLTLPVGKSLDLNFAHNNTMVNRADRNDLVRIAYYRNQGVGSWELNLGAFLHDLNTNICVDYDYQGLAPARATDSYADALSFLRYRYETNYDSLAPANRWFYSTNGLAVATALTRDDIDTYTVAAPPVDYHAPTVDYDRVNLPWAGSDSFNAYAELNDLFDTNRAPVTWLSRLAVVQQGLSTYDRYTLYRLLGQLGLDSAPALEDKLDLNYNNLPPYYATNLVPWTPTDFFHAAANRLIRTTRTTNVLFLTTTSGGRLVVTNFYLGENLVRSRLATTNIQVYPFNEYSPSLHRLLQVAVNLYDATTNRASSAYPYLPTVLRPAFTNLGTNLYISGYLEVTNAETFLRSMRLYDLTDARDRALLAADPNAVVYNIPLLVGAKKGLPNFNEFAFKNVAQLSRKVELRKASAQARPTQTNLLYQLTVSNLFGLEAWNSYTQAFSRPLRLYAAGGLSLMVSNTALPGSTLRFVTNSYATNLLLPNWAGRQFLLPIYRGVTVVSNDTYYPTPPRLVPGTNALFMPGLGFYVPRIELQVTNRFYYALVDETVTPHRLVDFVCLGGLSCDLDLTREIAGHTTSVTGTGGLREPANVWATNWAGVQNQVEISLGNIPISSQQWRSFSQVSAEGRDKDKSIDRLRLFCGLTPLVYWSPAELAALSAEARSKLSIQAGFSPTRKIYQDISWQANDPLVHYTRGDLLDPYNLPNDPNRTNAVRFAVPPQRALTNSNLGQLNQLYRPWGGNTNQSTDTIARDFRFKDPLIRQSDDWEFPTNKFPNIGWIGRVHRGSPWQTIYLKADIAPSNTWFRWGGNHGTHPTNDWNFVEAFTVAPNDNAARGLLAVNQTNLAAWSAVLNGVRILLPTNDLGGTEPILIGPKPAPPIATNLVAGIVEGINRVRHWETNLVPGGRGLPLFQRMGRLLATPELTFGSSTATNRDGTWTRWLTYVPRDEVLECIPQQVLSLVKEDEPRFAVYAFGQALREAPRSVYLGSGTFHRLCTNYQVTAEFASKSIIRITGPPTNPRAVVESYKELAIE